MIQPRAAVSTVAFVDEYCQTYRNLFSDIKNFEAFKFLHLGMISEIREILTSNCSHCWFKRWARAASFLQDTPWNVKV